MSSDKAPQINLKQSSDEDLVRIVTVQVHKYEPHTVQAAEAEISRRGIDKMRMTHLVKKVAQDNTAVQEIQDYMSTTWTRFVNFLIDFIVFLLLVLIGSLSLDSVFVTSNSDFLLAVGYGMVLLIFLLYHGLTEYFFQKTVGKYIT
ncbi:MAG: RDD family protein, partial [Bacteroidota bacterium]|nr:RDD family protein [Bacteroidota bacterium]